MIIPKKNKLQRFQRNLLNNIKNILNENMYIILFSDLEQDIQKNLMKWIFQNECKVWKDRGGRPEESINIFLSCISPGKYDLLKKK